MDLGKIGSGKNISLNQKDLQRHLGDIQKYKKSSPLKIRLDMKKQEYSSVDGKRESFRVLEARHQSTREGLNDSNVQKHIKNTLVFYP